MNRKDRPGDEGAGGGPALFRLMLDHGPQKCSGFRLLLLIVFVVHDQIARLAENVGRDEDLPEPLDHAKQKLKVIWKKVAQPLVPSHFLSAGEPDQVEYEEVRID